MENLHIVFWLFKDVSWFMVWKPLGIVMIIPTLIISVVIAVRTRQYMSEVCPQFGNCILDKCKLILDDK